MKKLFFCLILGLVSSAYAEDFEKDERTKENIRKELDSIFHMSFKADLCPVAVVGGTGGGIPIPDLPWKFGGGQHHDPKCGYLGCEEDLQRKPKCDGASEHGQANILVKGFFSLRFKVKLKLEINGEANAAHIHCKVDGGDGPVAATLNIDGSSQFTKPDLGNPCGYESFEDLYMAMKMNKTYIVIHSKEKPNGHLKGDVKPKY